MYTEDHVKRLRDHHEDERDDEDYVLRRRRERRHHAYKEHSRSSPYRGWMIRDPFGRLHVFDDYNDYLQFKDYLAGTVPGDIIRHRKRKYDVAPTFGSIPTYANPGYPTVHMVPFQSFVPGATYHPLPIYYIFA